MTLTQAGFRSLFTGTRADGALTMRLDAPLSRVHGEGFPHPQSCLQCHRERRCPICGNSKQGAHGIGRCDAGGREVARLITDGFRVAEGWPLYAVFHKNDGWPFGLTMHVGTLAKAREFANGHDHYRIALRWRMTKGSGAFMDEQRVESPIEFHNWPIPDAQP